LLHFYICSDKYIFRSLPRLQHFSMRSTSARGSAVVPTPVPLCAARAYSDAMRVLLIEDDLVIARELGLRWRAHGWVVQACSLLAEADVAIASASARAGHDLIVLDLELPDGDGLAWLARLRERDRLTPVLVLTARDRVADRVQGLRVGADDYLVKPFAVDELDARVDALRRRGQMSNGELLHFGCVTWMGDEGQAYVGPRALELSPREFEVLGLLIRRAPRLVSKPVLVEALAARNLAIGEAAAEVYVSRLRRKLAGSGVAIRTLRGFGYLLTLDGLLAPPDRMPQFGAPRGPRAGSA
jgi:DNA-binding response OmpR family regulator